MIKTKCREEFRHDGMVATIHRIGNYVDRCGTQYLDVFDVTIELGEQVAPLRALMTTEKAARKWVVAQFNIPRMWHILKQR